MTFWVYLWGTVFFLTLAGFAVMAVWVTVQGARDIGSMLAAIRERHAAAASPPED